MTQYYDHQIYEELLRYAALGLPCGSLTKALLLGDLSLAYKKAHPLLIPTEQGGKGESGDVIFNMFELIEQRFPPIIRGSDFKIEKWISHQGYSNASDKDKVMFELFAENIIMIKVRKILSNE